MLIYGLLQKKNHYHPLWGFLGSAAIFSSRRRDLSVFSKLSEVLCSGQSSYSDHFAGPKKGSICDADFGWQTMAPPYIYILFVLFNRCMICFLVVFETCWGRFFFVFLRGCVCFGVFFLEVKYFVLYRVSYT